MSFSRMDQITYLFVRHPLTILMGYVFVFSWGMTLLSALRSPSKHWDSVLALILHYGIGITVLIVFGWITFLLGFLVPALISSAIGSYLFYAQHNFPAVTFEDQHGWTYLKAALESSSYMKMSPVMKWFTGNIGYHHIHHTNARIPFYRLPEVYEDMPEFQNAKTTSLHPFDIYKCFRLKVWDAEAKQMLSLREIRSS